MNLLALNTVPSELLANCAFAANFETPIHVIRNGGIITGTPSINRGITLNGINESVAFDLHGNLLNSPTLSFVMIFYPNFNYDLDSEVKFIDTPSTHRTVLTKRNNAGSNVLSLFMGSLTLIHDISSAVYGPYWKVGEKNVIVIRGTSGDTSVWLNGSAILTSDATVWTPGEITTLYLGARFDGTEQNFDGKITSFKAFRSLLDAQDAQAYYDNSLANFLNDTTLFLPFTASLHDPSHVYDAPQDLNDGRMEDVTAAAYTPANSAILSKETSMYYGGSKSLRVTYNGVANPRADQAGVLTVGKSSRITGWVQGDRVLYPSVYVGSENLWDGTVSQGWQFLDLEHYVAVDTDVRLMATGSQAGSCLFDEFYIREILLADGNMKATGLGPWPIQVGTPSKQSDGEGGQCLRITGAGATGYTSQNILVEGFVYRARGEGRGDSLSGYPVINSDGVVDIWTGIPANVWREFDFLFTASGPILYYYMRGGPGYAEFRNLIIEKHEPRTIDVSGKGNFAKLGTGTLTSIPSKLEDEAGYYYDGSNDTLIIPDNEDLRIGTSDFFIALLVNRPEKNGNAGLITKGFAGSGEWGILTGSSQNNIAFVGDGATRIEIGAYVLDDAYWDGKNRTVFFTRIGDVMHLYLDGVLEVVEGSLGSLNLDSTVDMSIGMRSEGVAGPYKGSIKAVVFDAKKGLSSIQALGLHQDMMRGTYNV